MPLNRTAIYSALFERLSTITGLRTKSRDLKAWESVDALREMPALFMTSGPQVPSYRDETFPAIWDLTAWVYLYVAAEDKLTRLSPDEAILPFISAVEAALEYQAGDVPPATGAPFAYGQRISTTLGGLVNYARIATSGGVKTDEGNFSSQGVAVAVIAIEMQTVTG